MYLLLKSWLLNIGSQQTKPIELIYKGSLLLPDIRSLILLTIALISLSGCAGNNAYKEAKLLLAEGKTEQGFAKLEEAVELDPRNVQYRITLATERASLINNLIATGEAARRVGKLTEAEKAYRRVQAFEPENAMARQGMEALVRARRHRLEISEIERLLEKESLPDLKQASEKLRTILSENPKHKPSLYLKKRVDELRAKKTNPEVKLAEIFRKPISLEFLDAPLKSVLEVISKVSGLNFFYDKDVRPDLKVTVFAKNTTIEDSLRLLLVTNQLEQKVLNENSILIYPNIPQKLDEYQTLSVRSFYLTNADAKTVANSIKTIVKSKDMVIDERLGIIILRDTPQAIRMAERIVRLQDLSDPEVMLEVEIMEIKRSKLLELGIQWPSQLTLSPLQSGSEPLTLTDLRNLNQDTTQASIGNVIINARKENQNGNILANPRIRVRNKEKAKIQIGDRVPAITTTSTSTGFVSESINYIDVGLKLEVEPNIYLDGEVAIKVDLEVSNLVREVLSKSGTLTYQIGTRGASTVLRLKDGETQILAGLIGDEDRMTANKIPGLGDLPIVGRLFRSQKDDNQRSEILLSITPHIIHSIQRPDLLDAEFESGTGTSIGARTLGLETVDPSADQDQTKSSADTPTPLENTSPGANQPLDREPSAASQSALESGVNGGAVVLDLQIPEQIRIGEQFSAVVHVNSEQALRGMPIMLSFDPQVLQVANVQEGNFFKQNNGETSFTHRVDPIQGKVFAALVRQAANPQNSGINGSGDLLTVNFVAIKAGDSTRLQILSATPEPPPSSTLPLPIEQTILVVP